MPVPKPNTVPRWADGGTNTPTNVVQPPEHNSSIVVYSPGNYTVGTAVQRTGNEYIVLAISGTGTSTTGPVGTGTTIDNPGPNQVTWGFVTSTPVTKDSGWLPNTQPPAQWFNWLFFVIYQWILWIQDLGDQNFDGSGSPSNGPWTGLHKFTGGGGGAPAPVWIVSSAMDGSAGLDSTGASNASGSPGAGVTGHGGPCTTGQGGYGVQGYGSGVGQGGVFWGGVPSDPTAAGGDGLSSTGGPGANGATLYGGAVPSGGTLGGYGLEVTGGQGMSAIYANGGIGDAAAIQAIADPSGNGSGVAGVGFGAGPGIQGANLNSTGPGILGLANSYGGVGVRGEASYVAGAYGINAASFYSTAAAQIQNYSTGDALQCVASGGYACNASTTGTSGGGAIRAYNQSNATPTLSVTCDGNTEAIHVYPGSGNPGTASVVVASNGVALQGTGGGGAAGLSGIGGSSGGTGVVGEGGGATGSGVEGFGTSSGAGVTGANLAGGPGFEAANAHVFLNGTGAFIRQRISFGPASDSTINPWEKDTWRIPALSADTTWTLALPSGEETVRFKIRQQFFPPNQVHNLTIKIGPLTVVTFTPGTEGFPACVEFEWDPDAGWAIINAFDPSGNMTGL